MWVHFVDVATHPIYWHMCRYSPCGHTIWLPWTSRPGAYDNLQWWSIWECHSPLLLLSRYGISLYKTLESILSYNYFLTEAPKFGLQCEGTGDYFGLTFNCTLDEEVTSLQCFVDGQRITDCKLNTCSFTTRKPVDSLCRDGTKSDGAEAPPPPSIPLSLDKQEMWWPLISWL